MAASLPAALRLMNPMRVAGWIGNNIVRLNVCANNSCPTSMVCVLSSGDLNSSTRGMRPPSASQYPTALPTAFWAHVIPLPLTGSGTPENMERGMRGRVGANTVKGVMASPPHPLRVALHSGHAYKGLFTRHRPLMLIAKQSLCPLNRFCLCFSRN